MTQELPEGTVTVLFTDVEGSTDLTTSRGDEAAQKILRAQRELVRQQVEEHSGHEVKSLGDGFMVAFASARRAVACAVGIQRALEEHNRGQPLDEQVQVRIGMNTGEVLQEEADLFGETVNAAARIAAKAKGSQILTSETTKGVMGRAKDVELVDRGRFRLKGFPERWRLFEVVWQEETAVTPALMERTPFVGREAERSDLRGLLDQAAKGHGALVMVGGEPGVGKTRLAEEMMAEARQRGLLALTGHCYEMEGSPPYIPFVEIVEASARLVPPETLREALGDSAPEVAKLMPELRRLYPDIPAPPDLPPEQERRYLFNGMRDFLARAGDVQPMFLVLDDLQWADDATLLLLQHIAQGLHEMPVIVIGTYRDVELDVARPLARALEELHRQRLSLRISLKRLPQNGVSAMLGALSGQDPPQALVDVIYGETEGNPFFVEEVFHHLAEEGKLFDAKGRWRPDLEVSELDVPEGVRLVVGRRLERVCEECRHALTTAAVVGRFFSFELLEAVSDIETDALLDAIDEAERAHLITSTSSGAEALFSFAHELIRQTLLSGISAPRRQRLHLRVAEAMEQVYRRQVEEHAADLAHHLYQAGTTADPERTVRYLTLAGERALAAAAFEDALRFYENALSLQPADDRKRRADLLFKRGLVLRSLGRWEEALADWREALATYEELGDTEAVGRISSHITGQLMAGAHFVEAMEISRRGLSALGERVSADRCRLLIFGGWTLGGGGNYQAGETMISQALSMAEELGDRHLLGLVLAAKTCVNMWYLRPGEEVDSGLRSVELLRSAGDLWALADALWITQWTLLFLGRFDEAAEMAKEGEPLALRLGYHVAVLSFRRGSSYGEFMLSGDLDRWEQFWRGDLEMCRSVDMPWISSSYSALGFTHSCKGRLQEALESFQEAARLAPPGPFASGDWAPLFLAKAYIGDRDAALSMLRQKRGGLSLLLQGVRLLQGLRRGQGRLMKDYMSLQAYAGKRESVLATLRQQRGSLPRPGQPNTMGAWIMLLLVIEGLAVLEERGEAAKLYPLAVEATGTGALTVFHLGPPHKYAGIAAACGGQWEKAEEHYREALRLAHKLPVVIAQPEVRRWYARMLIDRDAPGDRDKAFRLLTEAIAMYRRIGMPKHVEMADALLGEA